MGHDRSAMPARAASSTHSLLSVVVLSLAAMQGATQEPGWHDPNIVLDGEPPHWVQIKEPSTADPQPLPPCDDKWKRNTSSIVVMAASYRESRSERRP